jgi:hypothetical protein
LDDSAAGFSPKTIFAAAFRNLGLPVVILYCTEDQAMNQQPIVLIEELADTHIVPKTSVSHNFLRSLVDSVSTTDEPT